MRFFQSQTGVNLTKITVFNPEEKGGKMRKMVAEAKQWANIRL